MKFKSFYLVAVLILLMSTKNYSQNTSSNPKALLNHIALYVVDLKASTDFYHKIIGLDTIPEPFHDGKHTWFGIGVKSHLHLISGAKEIFELPKNSHLCFSVASVTEFVANLKKHHISFENWAGEQGGITKRVDGVQQIYFKDPNGYWLEINDAKE